MASCGPPQATPGAYPPPPDYSQMPVALPVSANNQPVPPIAQPVAQQCGNVSGQFVATNSGPVMGAPVTNFGVAAPQGVPVAGTNDPRISHECFRCACCPPTFYSMLMGQCILESILIVVSFIFIFITPISFLNLIASILGCVASSITICKCKCSTLRTELQTYIVLVSIQLVLTVIEFILWCVVGAAGIAVGMVILAIFRGLCIYVAQQTTAKLTASNML